MTKSIGDIALRFSLKRYNRSWRGDCPACGYSGTFAVTTGRNGRAIGWCASCQDRQAVAAALFADELSDSPKGWGSIRKDEETRRESRLAASVKLWDASMPDITATPAGQYLTLRGLPSLSGSPVLRFHPACPHPERGRIPALIALVQGADGTILGVHRTYIGPDGGKAAVEPRKASLGPIWAGSIRLHEPNGGPLVIGEGIETSASAGLLAGFPAWAAISAGNLAKGLQLPSGVREIVIAADPDPPGEQAASAAKDRWAREGRRVQIMRPIGPDDFNDVLRARRSHA